MANELKRQLETRKDYVAQQGAISMNVSINEDKSPVLEGINGGAMALTRHAHGQMAGYTGIPKAYYDRMLEHGPELLCRNVTHWLHKNPDEGRLVRTLDGNVRGILSPKYRPLDNYDLADVALPVLINKSCKIVSADLTETRMYIKAVLPSLEAEIKGSRQTGDVVQAGIVISNSEVGAGAVRVEPMIYRLVCLNGMIAPDSALRKYHVGKGNEVDGIQELLTTETKRADDRAFWMKVRDVLQGAFNETVFHALVKKMEDAAQQKIEGFAPRVVEVVAERLGLPKSSGDSIMTHLIEGGDLSRWGLVNAITRCANEEQDYEFATTLERAGGKVLELAPDQWKEVSMAM